MATLIEFINKERVGPGHAQWPGTDLTSHYSEGLRVGYRYDHLHHIRPMYPFGYGLAYTRFSLHGLSVGRSREG